jgi:phytoene desaturase
VSRTRVAIIGAGIGGLASALILAKAGYSVSVYEKGPCAGGRMNVLAVDGFRFDTGPSWYLMPEIFEHFFELIGENITDHVQLRRLDPGYQVLFEHQPAIRIHGNRALDAATFEEREPGSADRLRAYLQTAGRSYELAKKYFLYNNFTAPWNMLHADVLAALPRLVGSLARSIDQNAAHYITDPSLRHILEYPSVFLGSSPYAAPALYSLMSHLDFEQGVYYPMGGMYTIIEALVHIGQKFGVEYVYNACVERIIVDGGRASGLEFKHSKSVSADIVISNADLHFTETSLLPEELQSYPERYWDAATAGPSALLLYLGVRGTLPMLEHHNLFFTDDWEGGFSAIFDHKTWPNPASLYVCVSSRTDPSVAPKGCENVFVLIPGPASTNDASAQQALMDRYIDQIALMAHVPDLKERIISKHVFGPQDFKDQFNAWQATALGMSHTLKQSALFRPKNKSRKVSNLYYVGAGTVPGIGLPMCLISAETLYKRLIHDASSGPLKHIKKVV